MAVIREDLDILKSSVTKLVSPSNALPPSPPRSASSSNGETTRLLDVDVATVSHDTKEKHAEPGANSLQYQYSVQAGEKIYPVYSCTHCTADKKILIPSHLLDSMHSKISQLALKGLQLVKEKGATLQATKIAKHKAKTEQRMLREALVRAEKEHDASTQMVEEVQSQLNAAWWELATVKHMHKELTTTLGKLNREVSSVREELQSVESQRNDALHDVDDVGSKLFASKHEVSNLAEQLKETKHELTKAVKQLDEANLHSKERECRTQCLIVSNDYLHQLLAREGRVRAEAEENLEDAQVSLAKANHQLQDLKSEKMRLADADADCQIPTESKKGEGADASDRDVIIRAQYLEMRNEYLVERLRVLENERDEVSKEALQTTASVLGTSSSRQGGRWWSLSLRARKRRGDEEQGAVYHAYK